RGDLPQSLLEELFRSVGGTPRFLDGLRLLLRKYDARQLQKDLQGAAGVIEKEREHYLQQIIGPKLYDLLQPEARKAVSRLAVSALPLPADAVERLAELTSEQAGAALAQAA